MTGTKIPQLYGTKRRVLADAKATAEVGEKGGGKKLE